MKQLLSLLFAMVIATSAMAQTAPPQAFNYNAAARDTNGSIMANRSIAVQISIIQGSASGTVVYVENDTATTNAFGLFHLAIGTGAVQSGVFANINWGSDNYYLQVAIDVNGGTNFVTASTTQLLSVPYALYAAKSGNASNGFTHYIGEQFGGGIIFYLYRDSIGQEHGLIVSKEDQSTLAAAWSNVDSTLLPGTTSLSLGSTWDGMGNTNAIINQPGHTASAAKICRDYQGGGFNDWYLPSIDELNLIYNNRFIINKTISNMGGTPTLDSAYWSSNQNDAAFAITLNFYSNNIYTNYRKNALLSVRAVRAF